MLKRLDSILHRYRYRNRIGYKHNDTVNFKNLKCNMSIKYIIFIIIFMLLIQPFFLIEMAMPPIFIRIKFYWCHQTGTNNKPITYTDIKQIPTNTNLKYPYKV